VLVCFILLIVVICAQVVGSWRCNLQSEVHLPRPQPPERKTLTAGIKDYARPEDDTYLSYPEWYIVWSYQEKADFQQNHLPSGFPYAGAVHQYWNSYCCILRLTRGKYSFNGGENVMLGVIGTSFSAEYLLKGAYEKTLGKVSEWTSGHQPVEEDQFAYEVARDYADFVHIRPFYEFHFLQQVRRLWADTHLWGPHLFRKWERRIFLTADYAIEAFYCWLVEKATHASYGYEPADTYAWIDNLDESLLQQFPRVKVVKRAEEKAFLVDIPRYQEFTTVASALAERNVHFTEIAGNSQIAVSVLAPEPWHHRHPGAQELFWSPVLTHPQTKRVILSYEVTSLAAALRALLTEGITIEHVYDY
jgi:hypothetical protein